MNRIIPKLGIIFISLIIFGCSTNDTPTCLTNNGYYVHKYKNTYIGYNDKTDTYTLHEQDAALQISIIDDRIILIKDGAPIKQGTYKPTNDDYDFYYTVSFTDGEQANIVMANCFIDLQMPYVADDTYFFTRFEKFSNGPQDFEP